MTKIVFVFILLFSISAVFGQRTSNHLLIDGTVLGYTFDDKKSIFKKEKQIELEGSLATVEIKVLNNKNWIIAADKTNSGGKFSFELKLGESYTLIYSKKGYGTSSFEIDLRNISPETAAWGLVLENVEILLNNFESSKPQDNGEVFGKLYFDQWDEFFNFKIHEFASKKKLFKNDEDNIPINLMNISLLKNSEKNKIANKQEESNFSHSSTGSSTGDLTEDSLSANGVSSASYRKSKKRLSRFENLGLFNTDFNKGDIDQFYNKITDARKLLESDRLNAVTEMDFLSIAAREKLLLSAERELESAKAYIGEQEGKLNAQSNFIYAIIAVLLLLLIVGIIIWVAYRNKKKSHSILHDRNEKIRKSIDYASKIQQSVLLTDVQIKEILPKSFVYYQPLDGVSGDFYWFSKIKDTLIIAAVDCTGHGVPGAFMSLIGNTLLNQIVNEKEIIRPAEILKQLHNGIVKSLHQNESDESAQDGMDISICCVDQKAGKLMFSGAMNSIYVYQNDTIKTLRADIQTIGGLVRKKARPDFTEHLIDINKGDRVYLFSDGFMDQFGGSNNEKFNVSRFKDLIVSYKNMEINKQCGGFEDAFKMWQGSSSQLDDVLVIGVEIV